MRGSLIYGVGTRDLSVPVTYKGKLCPYYQRWANMLKRCYAKNKERPTYEGCIVSEEWLYFNTFKAWMEKQDWEGKHLDKDILGDGKLYSENTCCFVSLKVNSFILNNKFRRGDLPIGVSFDKSKSKYLAQAGKKSSFKGYYDNPIDAHKKWYEEKLKQLEILKTDENLDENIYQGLLKNISKMLEFVLHPKEGELN